MKKSGLIQHLIGLSVILVAVILFCLPALQGKILNSHDFVSWKYISHESKTYTDEHGGPAYWTNNMFGGMPSYTSYSHDTGNWIGEFQNLFIFNIPRPVFLLLLCGLACYLLGCALGFSLWLRVLMSIAFLFSSYIPILASAGHDGKLLDIGYSCGVLAGMFYIINKRYWLGAAVYTFFFALLFCAGHYQIIYYLMLMFVIAGIAILIEELKQKDYKSTLIKIGIIAAGTIIGVMPTMQGVLLTKEYTKATMRGGQSELTIGKKEKKTNGGLDMDYAFTWSQGISETFSLVVPNVNGPMGREHYAEGATAEKLSSLGVSGEQAGQFLSSLPDYWGPQPFISGPVYFGVIVIMLCLFGFMTVKSYHRWWMLIASVFFIMLSWGKNFELMNGFLFHYLPGYNKFRTPSMALYDIPAILLPLMGAWGLHNLIKGTTSKEEALKAFKLSGGITLLLVLIGGVFSSFWQSFQGANYDNLLAQLSKVFGSAATANDLLSAMKEDMSSAVQADGIRSLVFLLLAAGLLWAFIKDKINANIMVVSLAVLIAVDLFSIDKRYLSDEQYLDADVYENENFGPRPVDTQILQDKDPYYRVQDLTVDPYNNARAAYFHKLVGGYNPAKMETYQDLITVQLSKNNKEVYNMLNTKYFIVPGQNNAERVMPNPDACGNAWFVNEIKMVKTADEEMLSLNAPSLSGDSTMTGTFNPRTTAIVRETFKDKISKTTFTKDSTAQIKLTQYGINNLKFESNNTQEGFGVFSDIYYDGGWHCLIDGKEAPIVRANYVLRGVMLPAGKHQIEFNFEPGQAKLGKTISMLGSALAIAVCLLGLGMAFKRKEINGDVIE